MSEQTFRCYVTRALRKHGIEGAQAWVRVNGETIDLTGTDGGQLRIRLDDIERMRVGYLDAKSRSYELRVWRWGTAKPLRLTPTKETWAGYREAVMLIANTLDARQRRDRIESGYSKFDAILGPSMMGLLVIGAIGVSIFALGNEPWWGRLLVPAIPTLIFGVLLWLAVVRHWPRPIANVSELHVQLPPDARR